MENDYIQIYKEWVTIEDYQFKILVLASFLEDSNLAYYGTYSSMCEWLGITNCTKNINKLKEEIKQLEQMNFIDIDRKSERKFIITITNKAKKDKRIVEIKKCWVEILKLYTKGKKSKINKNWDTMLKTLVVICYKMQEAQRNNLLTKNGIILTMSELATEIGRCEATASKILKELQECNFLDGFTITKEALYTSTTNANGEKQIRGLGTHITANYEWNK